MDSFYWDGDSVEWTEAPPSAMGRAWPWSPRDSVVERCVFRGAVGRKLSFDVEFRPRLGAAPVAVETAGPDPTHAEFRVRLLDPERAGAVQAASGWSVSAADGSMAHPIVGRAAAPPRPHPPGSTAGSRGPKSTAVAEGPRGFLPSYGWSTFAALLCLAMHRRLTAEEALAVAGWTPGPGGGLAVAAGSFTAPRPGHENEDKVAQCTFGRRGLRLVGVFDGHGTGPKNTRVASMGARGVWYRFLELLAEPVGPPAALDAWERAWADPATRTASVRAALVRVMADLDDDARAHPGWMGAVACVVVVDSALEVAHAAVVGDCFAVVVSRVDVDAGAPPAAVARRFSADQVGSDPCERARVAAAGGFVSTAPPRRTMGNYMPSRVIGDWGVKRLGDGARASLAAVADLSLVRLRRGVDVAVAVCSDGCALDGWSERIVPAPWPGEPAKPYAHRLACELHDARVLDDTTVAAALLRWTAPAAAAD